jgi:hypothetical protein
MTQKYWQQLVAQSPALAATGRRLLYRGGNVAAGYLATVAPDGGPRVHPVFPVLTSDDLWLFIVNISPKYRDLIRNERYALHSLPTASGSEELHLRGLAQEISDGPTKNKVVAATQSRQGTADFESLFRLSLTSVLVTEWENWGTSEAWPSYSKWIDPDS